MRFLNIIQFNFQNFQILINYYGELVIRFIRNKLEFHYEKYVIKIIRKLRKLKILNIDFF